MLHPAPRAFRCRAAPSCNTTPHAGRQSQRAAAHFAKDTPALLRGRSYGPLRGRRRGVAVAAAPATAAATASATARCASRCSIGRCSVLVGRVDGFKIALTRWLDLDSGLRGSEGIHDISDGPVVDQPDGTRAAHLELLDAAEPGDKPG